MHDEIRAGGMQCAHDGRTDAARAARDQYGLVAQVGRYDTLWHAHERYRKSCTTGTELDSRGSRTLPARARAAYERIGCKWWLAQF